MYENVELLKKDLKPLYQMNHGYMPKLKVILLKMHKLQNMFQKPLELNQKIFL